MTLTKNNVGKVTGRFSFPRGVHPPHNKSLTETSAIQPIRLTAGQQVVVPMSQHIGAPCRPTVEVKQEVTAGQEIGTSGAFVSAPVHSPVNGTVKQIAPCPHPGGSKVLSAVITLGDDQPDPNPWRELPPEFDVERYDYDTIINAIRQAGIVGMGGAAFPTAIKLTRNEKRPVNTVLLNGCECEPFLTSDHRLMLEATDTIVAGLRLAMAAAKAEKGIIAVEDNKPDAIGSLLMAIKDLPDIQLAICRTKYPQGGEKQLINAVLGLVVPTGGLPLDVGVVVVNVGTAAAITWACWENRPLIERVVTVTGNGILQPGNFIVPVGMLVSDLFAYCGGLTDDAAKIVLGGPMMGPTAARLDVPVLKGTSGITILTHKEVSRIEQTACIRCSRCVDYCPLGLVPTRIAHAVKARNLEMAQEYDLQACCECGCCSYVCPAQIPLLQYLRAGKEMARKAEKEQ